MQEEHRDAPPPEGQLTGRVRVYPLVSLFAWGLAIGIALYFFYATRLILLTLLGAGCLAAVALPIKRALPGPSWFRGAVAGFSPILVILGILTGLGFLLTDRLRQQFQRWPQIKERINQMLAQWTGWLGLDGNVTVEAIARDLQRYLSGAMLSEAASIITTVLVVLALLAFGTLYLLTAGEGLLMSPLVRALPPRHREPLAAALHELVPRLRLWVFGTIASIVIIGFASWGGYSLIGLELAVPIALFAGFAEIVPTFGPASALVVALFVAATQGTTQILGVIGVWAVVQFLESYIVLPLVMKEAVRLPPLVTLFTVVFWAYVLGPGGLLLALPLDLAIWALFRRFVLDRQPPLSSALEAQLKSG